MSKIKNVSVVNSWRYDNNEVYGYEAKLEVNGVQYNVSIWKNHFTWSIQSAVKNGSVRESKFGEVMQSMIINGILKESVCSDYKIYKVS